MTNLASSKDAKVDLIISVNGREVPIDLPLQELREQYRGKEIPDDIQDSIFATISEPLSEQVSKSRTIRRFQRFGPDHELASGSDANALFEASIQQAKSDYAGDPSILGKPFSRFLVEASNVEVGELTSEDAVAEWLDDNEIEWQVKRLLTQLSVNADLAVDIDKGIGTVVDECELAADRYLQMNDKSNGLESMDRLGHIDIVISNRSDIASSIRTSSSAVEFRDFVELGVSGLIPNENSINLMKMAGVSPADFVAELRDELEYEDLLEWSTISREHADSFPSSSKIEIHDFLDMVEACGDATASPVYLVKARPSDFSSVNPGESISIEHATLAMVGVNGEVRSVMEVGNVSLSYDPSSVSTSLGVELRQELAASFSQVEPGRIFRSEPTKGIDLGEVFEEEVDEGMEMR